MKLIVDDPKEYEQTVISMDRLLPAEYEERYENFFHDMSEEELNRLERIFERFPDQGTLTIADARIPQILLSGLLKSALRKKRMCNDVQRREATRQ